MPIVPPLRTAARSCGARCTATFSRSIATSTPANFDGRRPVIDPDDSAVACQGLIERDGKAQAVVKNNEALDSQR